MLPLSTSLIDKVNGAIRIVRVGSNIASPIGNSNDFIIRDYMVLPSKDAQKMSMHAMIVDTEKDYKVYSAEYAIINKCIISFFSPG